MTRSAQVLMVRFLDRTKYRGKGRPRAKDYSFARHSLELTIRYKHTLVDIRPLFK